MNSTAFFSLPHRAFAAVTGLFDEPGLYLTYVLIGTYDLLPFCNLDGQMARRGSEFHFAPYHIENETDCQAFRNAFSSLLKQIPLRVDHDGLLQRWWYFFEGSLGCIGILKQWLVRALYRALREASAELTRAHLEKAVLPDAKWERMRADARSGEAEFQYADRQNGYLSNLASMPTFVPKPPDLAPAPPLRLSPKTWRLIRRSASRSVVSVSHLPVEIRWARHRQREKPPIVRSQGQFNWRWGDCWSQRWKSCNARRVAR